MEGFIKDKKVVFFQDSVMQGECGIDEINISVPTSYNGTNLTGLDAYLRVRFKDGFEDKIQLTKGVLADKITLNIKFDNTLTRLGGSVYGQISFENADGSVVYITEPFTFRIKESVSGFATAENEITPTVYNQIIAQYRQAIADNEGKLDETRVQLEQEVINSVTDEVSAILYTKEDKTSYKQISSPDLQAINSVSTCLYDCATAKDVTYFDMTLFATSRLKITTPSSYTAGRYKMLIVKTTDTQPNIVCEGGITWNGDDVTTVFAPAPQTTYEISFLFYGPTCSAYVKRMN